MNKLQNFSSIDTLLWDWNGTLLDDVEICLTAMNRMLAHRKMSMVTRDFYYKHFTFPVKRYYEALGWDFTRESFDDISVEFMANYDALFNSSPLHPNTFETLKYFKSHSFKQIVVSALEQNRLKESLAIHGLDQFFEAAYGIENILGGGKIHMAKKMLAEQKLILEKTCMIGDTEHDLEVAQAIGTHCVLIAHGHHTYERLQGLPVPVVHNFNELKDAFI
ncbi:MAG: HAD hydrolase-like protein [Bacteroidota bacterium]|nr:HAD hydrolase-like protein [Bacteroidota bacterium]MDP4289903.1 HAD hydrolase-like protein [Bacteroidota bacterium]